MDCISISISISEMQNFRMTLKCIKICGQSVVTFILMYGKAPTGINWSLLVVRICQIFPSALPNLVVSRFFRVYAQCRCQIQYCFDLLKKYLLDFKFGIL